MLPPGPFGETRGTYHIDLLEFGLAIDDLDRAIALRDRPYLRFLRGLALCQAGSFDRGVDDLDAAVLAPLDNLQFYRGRGVSLVLN